MLVPLTVSRLGLTLFRYWPIALLTIASFLTIADVAQSSPISLAQAQAGDYLTVSTDKTQYFLLETVNIWGHAVTPDTTWTYACAGGMTPCGLSVRISIYGANGVLILDAMSDASLGDYKSYYFSWLIPCNVGGMGLGDNYTVEASMQLGSEEISGRTTIFIGLPMGATMEALSIATDKPAYDRGETVRITGLFQSGAIEVLSPAFVEIYVNITQSPFPEHRLVFETRLHNLTATVYSSANCAPVDYPYGEDYPLPSVYFATSFKLSPNTEPGIYLVRAVLTNFTGRYGQVGILGGTGQAFFTVGQLTYTTTLAEMTTSLREMTFLTTESSSLETAQIQGTLVLTSLVTTTLPEFHYVVGVIAVSLVLSVLLTNSFVIRCRKRKRSTS